MLSYKEKETTWFSPEHPLTPTSLSHLEKLKVCQLFSRLAAIYEAERSIALFKTERPPPPNTATQFNLVCTHTFHFLRIYLNIILSLRLLSPKWCRPFRFPNRIIFNKYIQRVQPHTTRFITHVTSFGLFLGHHQTTETSHLCNKLCCAWLNSCDYIYWSEYNRAASPKENYLQKENSWRYEDNITNWNSFIGRAITRHKENFFFPSLECYKEKLSRKDNTTASFYVSQGAHLTLQDKTIVHSTLFAIIANRL